MIPLSFVLPVRIDNEQRKENLYASLKFINKYFHNSEIVLIENYSKATLSYLTGNFKNIRYIFYKNDSNFSRSTSINEGAMAAKNDIIVIYDLDVLINPDAIIRCSNIIHKGANKIIIPHNTFFINVAGKTKEKLIKTLDAKDFPKIPDVRFNNDLKLYPIPSGVILADRNVFLAEGGMNKKMISYGWEDIEFLERMKIMGHYPRIYGKYNIIHLDHERGPDSRINLHYENNKKEFQKVKQMDREVLQRYIREELNLYGNSNIMNHHADKVLSEPVTFGFFSYFINKLYFFIFKKYILTIYNKPVRAL